MLHAWLLGAKIDLAWNIVNTCIRQYSTAPRMDQTVRRPSHDERKGASRIFARSPGKAFSENRLGSTTNTLVPKKPRRTLSWAGANCFVYLVARRSLLPSPTSEVEQVEQQVEQVEQAATSVAVNQRVNAAR